jgi:hypothetical protein
MIKAIREAGRVPVQRDTFYEPLNIAEATGPEMANPDVASSKLLESNLATA